MSRVIKFRAWDKTSKKMIWSFDLKQHTNFPATAFNLPSSDCDVKLMQFTGLIDKNSKEIFEGDILKWVSRNPFSIGETRMVRVMYVEAWYWCSGSIGIYLAELLANEKAEVIGNIYENPKLLNPSI